MRFVEVSTLRLVEFVDSIEGMPDYAILSHTWAEEEVTFKDMETSDYYKNKKGWDKIRRSAAQAAEDKLRYVWVDTCCIDKSSSAELSEAINSMYKWYARARVCYAFLADVETVLDNQAQFIKSRWFTRGWTLQELLAPSNVVFYNMHWKRLGTKKSLANFIGEATHIDTRDLLSQSRAMSRGVAQKFRWASKRETTRVEDRAYSLLGILRVNMPLLYGEGIKAFQRLQEEIIKQSEDQSLLAWGMGLTLSNFLPEGALALSPTPFKNCIDDMQTFKPRFLPGHSTDLPPTPWQVTSRGLRIDLPLIHCEWLNGLAWAPICFFSRPAPEGGSVDIAVIIPLRRHQDGTYWRTVRSTPLLLDITADSEEKTATAMPPYMSKARYSSVFVHMPLTLKTLQGLYGYPSSVTHLDVTDLEASGFKAYAWCPSDGITTRSDDTVQVAGDLGFLSFSKSGPHQQQQPDEKQEGGGGGFLLSPPQEALTVFVARNPATGLAEVTMRVDAVRPGCSVLLEYAIVNYRHESIAARSEAQVVFAGETWRVCKVGRVGAGEGDDDEEEEGGGGGQGGPEGLFRVMRVSPSRGMTPPASAADSKRKRGSEWTPTIQPGIKRSWPDASSQKLLDPDEEAGSVEEMDED
ncbi:uncharacterized protein E0L32_005701 [Thyridium curvatum]|uniref:Uncharacterized protein n=1 Tax=Thyridium curvatum TaxID=1093900 RepID=A0A507BAB0_9PEZI|nr:uncharacterized protein E0L32_005701 [Thyridium curvatum]TPX14001.1 hypothetical protein E0L32_005701 [Thyridium curvatum]